MWPGNQSSLYSAAVLGDKNILETHFRMRSRRRISLAELRELIIRCPAFTARTAAAAAPSTLPLEEVSPANIPSVLPAPKDFVP